MYLAPENFREKKAKGLAGTVSVKSYLDLMYPNGGKALYTFHETEQCHQYSPDKKYYCTRQKGHLGEHEAHYGQGMACMPPWSDGAKVPEYKPYGGAMTWPAQYICKVGHGSCCGKQEPIKGNYSCSREKGHEGPHEAHFAEGVACTLPWFDADVPNVEKVTA